MRGRLALNLGSTDPSVVTLLPVSNRTPIQDVLDHQVCVGCGACAVREPAIRMVRTPLGIMMADIGRASTDALARASAVCPFAIGTADEDEISAELYGQLPNRDRRTGPYLSLLGGRVARGEEVTQSSSGGMTSWLSLKLLEAGLIDAVVHVGAVEPSGPDRGALFGFQVSTSATQLRSRRKSQYYSASFETAIQSIRGDSKRYLFIGVPCYVKAIRLLCRADAVLQGQIRFAFALVCGHMKSAAFAELMAWQVGVPPDRLRRVDFREKVPGLPSYDYNFAAVDVDEVHHAGTSNKLMGGNWGHASVQLEACDYCDDIFGETADVVFGDAWIPRYVKAWQGTNVVLNRHAVIEQILRDGQRSGELELDALSVAELAESQAGNFRHRWDGLSVRLQDRVQAGAWVPRKRIAPGSRPVSEKRRAIVRLRQQMAQASHGLFLQAKTEGSLAIFIEAMRPMASEMNALSRQSFAGRLWRRTMAALRRLLPV